MSDTESLGESSKDFEEWEVVNNSANSDSEPCYEENDEVQAIDKLLVAEGKSCYQKNEKGLDDNAEKDATNQSDFPEADLVQREQSSTLSQESQISVLYNGEERVRFFNQSLSVEHVFQDEDDSQETDVKLLDNASSSDSELCIPECDTTLAIYEVLHPFAQWRYVIFTVATTLLVLVLLISGGGRAPTGLDTIIQQEPVKQNPLFECKSKLHDKLRKLADCRTSNEFCHAAEKPNCRKTDAFSPVTTQDRDKVYKRLLKKSVTDSRRLSTEKAALQNQLETLQENLTQLLVRYNDIRISKMLESDFLRRSNSLLAEQLKNKSLENENLQANLANSQQGNSLFPTEESVAKNSDESSSRNSKFQKNQTWKTFWGRFTGESEKPRLSWQKLFGNLTRRFVDKLKPEDQLENLALATTNFLNQSLTSLNKFYNSLENSTSDKLYSAKNAFFEKFGSEKFGFEQSDDKKCTPKFERPKTRAVIKLELSEDTTLPFCDNKATVDFFAEIGKKFMDQLKPSQENMEKVNKLTTEIFNASINKFTTVVDSFQQTVDAYLENSTHFLDNVQKQLGDFWFDEATWADDSSVEVHETDYTNTVENDTIADFEHPIIDDIVSELSFPIDDSDLQSPNVESQNFVEDSLEIEEPNKLASPFKNLKAEVKLLKNALKKSNLWQILGERDCDAYLNTLKNFGKFNFFDLEDQLWWQCQKMYWAIENGNPKLCTDLWLKWQIDDQANAQRIHESVFQTNPNIEWVVDNLVNGVKLVNEVYDAKFTEKSKQKGSKNLENWMQGRWRARQLFRRQEDLAEQEVQWVFNREKERRSNRRWVSGG